MIMARRKQISCQYSGKSIFSSRIVCGLLLSPRVE